MTWWRAGFYVVVWFLLTAAWLWTKPPGPDGVPREQTARRAGAPFGGLTPAEVDQVEMEGAAGRARFVRSGDGWRTVAPTEGTASRDLLSAFLSALLETEGAETVSGATGRDAEFGLDAPTGRIVLGRREGPPLRIVLGTRNPAATAVYARAEGVPEVILLGLNVPYYADLALRAAAAGGG